ncbi:tetratricopeptide repeat protein [Streptomyces sp. bgisy153]|uniref:tetratricopeptide repeat protein n=1 Tax=Streptomyces sp. bgisy153 TaxID=3413793 RepID=UPI003D73E7C0
MVKNLRVMVETQDNCFIWLDDLEHYIGPDGLTPSVLAAMRQYKLRAIATMRAEQRRRLSPIDDITRDFDDAHGHNALGSRVLDQLDTVVLPRIWSEKELARAREVKDSRVASAVAHSRLFGVAEYLAAGPRLYQEWSLAPDVNPRGAALVAVAVDLARAGITGEVPLSVLLPLHELYLHKAGGDVLRPESPQAALDWATRRRYGVTSFLLPIKAGSHYRVFDYLPDALARSSEAPEIPPETWESALDYAQSASLSFHVGMAAVQHENWEVAEKAWVNDLEKHPIQARINLGRVYRYLKKIDKAKIVWQEAVDLGSIDASINLGSQYEREGRLRQAIELYRIGAEKGNTHAIYHLAYAISDDKEAADWWLRIAESDATDASGAAAFNLSSTYHRLGDMRSTGKWLRVAVARGNVWAMTNLGAALLAEGNEEEALDWFKRAANSGDAKAHVRWAEQLIEKGDTEGAIELLEKAIKLGENYAYNVLGLLHAKGNDGTAAEAFWRKGFEADDSACAVNLGILLQRRNDLVGAEEAYRKASAAGIERASFGYAFLLAEHGDPEEAEIQFRKALPIAAPGDIYNFGHTLSKRHLYDRAMNWLNLAMLKGDTWSGCLAGQLHIRAGFIADGERLLRIAFDGGHQHAGTVLTKWLVRTGRGVAAAQLMRSAQAIKGRRTRQKGSKGQKQRRKRKR